MEMLKPIDEISAPDFRNTLWVREDGGKLSFEECYSWAEHIGLKDSVPEEIRSQWNVARNVWLYSWHVYSFHQVAEMKAFSVLELALKTKLDNPKLRGLWRHVNDALKRGYFNKDDFVLSNGPNNPMTNEEYVNGLPDFVCHFRNKHAHEGTMLHPASMLILGTCADMINQLYSNA
ncbi:MAG: hypothetical protein PF495_10900 [Spirochaetales bacterium]|jgi:hypothetical protein|nr:hypothetical protein [Spirochaetales bacterium]